ncbi:protein of unknown function DUF1206 [Gloeothece citriformis PCC 7424]|uniref:DUF1206 domain-containing protein n=1 Tax=Gloeothece citriformis (strain PCC 7424) TaxID=65393 RepID=B7KKL0_GLOC7|nr:DUF1206 domain-containing protein [Gloeothece citriformis]ACK72343.1 protein of unknown function DUF1206 [Gloeothece citriformis PCC 7424]
MVLEKLARAGYFAKGIIYGLIGILAILAAFNAGGKTTDANGVLHTIAGQPFGQILLILLGIGLFGYAIWRFVEAALDPEHENRDKDANSLFHRLSYAISGVIYTGLAVQAILLVIDASSSSGGGNSTADWTARLLSQPFGRWLVGLVGAVIIGFGFYQLYKAYKAKFRGKLNLRRLTQEQEKWVIRIGQMGISARGIVFVIIGFFLIQAGRQYDPQQARGLDGALQTLARQPYGKLLLAIVALGLAAYGLFMIIQSRYRRISTPSVRPHLPV